jgi:argininosuccinate lyase
VNTDLRLFIKQKIIDTTETLENLQSIIVSKAEEQLDTLMPGYTHLQRAQPVLLSHHLMAYFWMSERDKNRLEDCLKRVDVLPLGSAALAGTTLELDQNTLAAELGFSKITDNSLDSVSDRDFVIEFLSALSIIQTHLSRLAEEIVLWTSSEFVFAVLPDSLATGSSMMPHKKNPDAVELIRGKTGRVFGDLIAILTTLKGLPLSYNRDLQEDKEVLFDAVDTVGDCLDVMSLVVEQIQFQQENMKLAADDWLLYVTDLMEFLVSEGEPVRHAHEAVGKIISYCLDNDKALFDLSNDELNKFSAKLSSDVFKFIGPVNPINSKKSIGSTSKISVESQIQKAKKLLKK